MSSVSDLSRIVESSEARAYADLIDHAPRTMVDRYGLAVHRQGCAHVFVAAGLADSLLLNRVVALGIDGADLASRLDDATSLYAQRDVRTFAVEMAPLGAPDETGVHLAARGFAPFKRTSMLHRQVEPAIDASSDLRIARARPADAHAFSDIASSLFGFGEPIPALLRATFDRPASWQHWMAFDEQIPVAVAMTHVAEDVAWIGWVATLPSHRGRGAQSALTGAQLRGAAALGCRLVTLEASPGTKRGPSQSLRNYLRLGFTVAHERTVYVYRGQARRDPADGRHRAA